MWAPRVRAGARFAVRWYSSVDYASYFSAATLRRQPSAIRALQPLVALEGMLSLGGGMPNPGLFPVKGLQLTVEGGEELVLDPAELEAALQCAPRPATVPAQLSHAAAIGTRPPPASPGWCACCTNCSWTSTPRRQQRPRGWGSA